VNTVASKIAWVSGKRGFLVALSLLAAFVAAKGGGNLTPVGFFDGG
jgi:hypothetical protein